MFKGCKFYELHSDFTIPEILIFKISLYYNTMLIVAKKPFQVANHKIHVRIH